MRHSLRCLSLVAALAGCGTTTVALDAPPPQDAAPPDRVDAAPEVTTDVALDVTPDAPRDAPRDVSLDAPREASLDAVVDVAPVDVAPERCEDRVPREGTCGAVGCRVAPFSLPACDAAGTPFAFYGPSFCDARLTLVDVVGAWCVPCQREAAEIERRITRAYAGRVRVLTVLVENRALAPATAADCEAWRGAYGLTSQMLLDPTRSRLAYHGARALPFKMIVDREGRVRWRTDPGGAALTVDGAVAVLERLLGDPTLTRSGSFCGTPSPSYACAPWDASRAVAPSTDCATADVEDYVSSCFDAATATPARCTSWLSGARAATACGRCVARWVSSDGAPRFSACPPLHLGGADATARRRCLDAWGCVAGCHDDACGPALCPSADVPAADLAACSALVAPGGRCHSLSAPAVGAAGAALDACLADPTYRAAVELCAPSATRLAASVEWLLRGACRDGGRWQRAVVDAPPVTR